MLSTDGNTRFLPRDNIRSSLKAGRAREIRGGNSFSFSRVIRKVQQGGPLYRNLKESPGPWRREGFHRRECIIKNYQEISRPATTERGGQRRDAKLYRSRSSQFRGIVADPTNNSFSPASAPLVPTTTQAPDPTLYQHHHHPCGRFSRSLSSTLDWTERLLFQARERPLTPRSTLPSRTKCFPGRLARCLAA